MATKKLKRFEEGGVVGNSNYPFGQGQVAAAPAPTTGTSFNGLGNTSPLVQVNAGAAETTPMGQIPEEKSPIQMKKGGAVKANRGDGIAQRGKTRGRMV